MWSLVLLAALATAQDAWPEDTPPEPAPSEAPAEAPEPAEPPAEPPDEASETETDVADEGNETETDAPDEGDETATDAPDETAAPDSAPAPPAEPLPAEPPGTDAAEDPDAPPAIEGEAEEIGGISSDQHSFLKPKRFLLEQNPYAQVDFTAYTLEWGEVMVGLGGVYMGVLPRVQMGTQPVFDLLGVYNLNLKTNIVRAGPVDLGLIGQGFYLPLGDFKASFLGGGPAVSWIIVDKWSLHAAALYGSLQGSGIPTDTPLVFRAFVSQDELEELAANLRTAGVEPSLGGGATLIRFATDYRLNRRDSLVLLVQGIPTGQIGGTLGDGFTEEQQLQFGGAWVATLSWQFAWQQIGARVGGGVANTPLPWILQANNLTYRFWGKTRLEDRRRKKGWRDSKEEVGR